MNQDNSFHQPVMVDEAVEFLAVQPEGRYIDATAGGGGYSIRIASQLGPTGRLLAIDRDIEAIERTGMRLREFESKIEILEGNFSDLNDLAHSTGFSDVNGVVFDLGVSGYQFDNPARGFSYRQDGPLDFRMDSGSQQTAEDIINDFPGDKIMKILYELGGERNSRKITFAIERARAKERISSTKQFAEIIGSVTNPRFLNKTLSRCFQSIRMVVNDELENLLLGLKAAFSILAPEGRLVVVSYHSLEDRIVKNFIRDNFGKKPGLDRLTKKPLTASASEIRTNSRARSAKLRAAQRL